MHEGGRMQQFGPASPLPQIQGEESGGQQLALCDDHPLRHLPRIGGSLRSHPGQCAFHRPGGLLTPANEQLFDAPHVFALQSGQQQRHLPVATARRSERSDPLQSVRRTGHGRKHHDSSSFAYKNICHPPHVGSAAHRSPAEFQNLHHSRFFIHQYNLRHKYIIFIFQKQIPQIQVQVTVSNRRTLQKMLLNNQLDIALIEGGVDDSHLHGEAFGGDRLVLITPPYHPLLKKKDVTLLDLLAYPLLLREKNSSVRIFVEQLFAVEGLPPLNPHWESASTQAIVQAVSYGMGISLLPEPLVKRDILLGTVCTCSVVGADLCRQNYVVWDKHKFLTKATQEFIALCKKHTPTPKTF